MTISGTVPPHITHFNDIGDVNVPAPVDGYFVYWDAAANKWQCKHISTTVNHLNNIGDVNVPAPTDQYFFYWDNAAGKWQCRALVDSDIPGTIARDAEVAADIAAHAALPTVHQDAPALVATHAAIADAHHIKTTLFTDLTDRWTLAQAHRGADNKIMVFKGAATDPVEEDKPVAEVGGLYGINVETLTDHKTLTPNTDKIYQYLIAAAAFRYITLDTANASAGDRFVIRNNDAYNSVNSLTIRQGATVLDRVKAGGIKEFIFDGTNWVSRGIGTGENDNKKYNIEIGTQARGYGRGTAIGYLAQAQVDGIAIGKEAQGHNEGVAIGPMARGYDRGVALGYSAYANVDGVGIGKSADGRTRAVAVGEFSYGYPYGIAIGYYARTNPQRYSIALGYHSRCERYGETSINIDSDLHQYNNVVQGRWSGTIYNDTPAELFCAKQSGQRFTIRPKSVLAFRMIITARDDVAGHVAMYTVANGLIKRDAANNTAMALPATVTVVYEDDAAWAVTVTADDTNEALIITVIGDDTNPTKWVAVMDGVETHF